MIKAIYPGTFDPITVGHLDVILRGAKIYDHLIVAVMENRSKTIAIRKGVYYLCFPIGCAFSVVHLIDLILNRRPEDAPRALRGEEGIDV